MLTFFKFRSIGFYFVITSLLTLTIAAQMKVTPKKTQVRKQNPCTTFLDLALLLSRNLSQGRGRERTLGTSLRLAHAPLTFL